MEALQGCQKDFLSYRMAITRAYFTVNRRGYSLSVFFRVKKSVSDKSSSQLYIQVCIVNTSGIQLTIYKSVIQLMFTFCMSYAIVIVQCRHLLRCPFSRQLASQNDRQLD